MRIRLLILLAATLVAGVVLSAQSSSANASDSGSDLDAFMSQVLERRDENWTKLQQYVLAEDEAFQMTGPDGRRLWGSQSEYVWFPQDGLFVRSPVKSNGVAISEADRRKAEDLWIRREQGRTRRTVERDSKGDVDVEIHTDAPPGLEELVARGDEPRFVSSAYFMRFKFDPGHYALVGRERLLDRDVLRIEYYPTRLFSEGRTRPNKQLREKDADINRKMNKAAFVTLWIEPRDHQILQYEFSNTSADFLPARWLVRIDELHASMRMAQAFPGVWLPDTIALRFGLTLPIGEVAARYDVRYHDYRLADVKTRVR